MIAIAQPRRRATTPRALVLVFPSGRTLLGAVPPDSTFADLVLPQSQVSSRAGFRSADRSNILSALAQDFIPAYGPCKPGTGMAVVQGIQAAGQAAMKLAPATGPAAPFVAMGGAIANLFGSIFGGHAAAVGLEQATLCTAIPAANSLLQQIEAAVASGQVTAAQASALLDQVLLQYESGVGPILKMSSSACNAACVYLRMLRAIVAKRKAEFSELAAKEAASAPATAAPGSSSFGAPGVSVTAATSGSPLLWAAAAVLGVLLWKGGI